jgi:peptidoglycan/LPS O-acetylase OafA/YrhL
VERAFSRHWPVVVALAALVVTQLAGLVHVNGLGGLGFRIAASVPSAILLGVVLAHVLNTRRGFEVVYALAGRKAAPFFGLALALTGLALEQKIGFFGELGVAAGLVCLVATCVVREDNALAPFLRLKPVAWVGTISFGIYLLHVLCIAVLRKALGVHAGAVTLFVGATLASVALASVSYLTYERQFLKLKERWFGDRTAAKTKQPTHPVVAPAVLGSRV